MSAPTRTSPPIGGRPPRWDSRRRPSAGATPPEDVAASLTPPLEKVNLAHASSDLSGDGTARPVGTLHGQPVHLARLTGTGPWHRHATGDALYFVTRGHLRVELRERAVELEAGELLIVPSGVEHRFAATEALVLTSAPLPSEEADGPSAVP